MKLRDVLIKVHFKLNKKEKRKLHKRLKITKESFGLTFLSWPRWNLRGNNLVGSNAIAVI